MKSGIKTAVVAIAICAAAQAKADSCVDPFARNVLSPNSAFTLKFVPNRRDCKKVHCDDSPRSTGELAGHSDAPSLTLLKTRAQTKRQAWSIKLTDWPDGPSGLAVADTGYALIADQWCNSGNGLTLALYSPDGNLQKKWSLAEILPANHFASLFQSSFNIHWRGAIRYDPIARAFAISVAYPDRTLPWGSARTVDLLLDPERGTFAPRDQQRWDEAQSHAEKAVRARCAFYAWRMKRASSALSAPIGPDRMVWLNFAMELERRNLIPKVEGVWNQRLFLSAPADADYATDLKEFQRVLTMTRGDDFPQDFYLLSPDIGNAHTVIKSFLAQEESKNLGNDRFVVVANEPEASTILATIAEYGGRQVRVVGLREAVQPAADKKDLVWQDEPVCAG